MEITHLVFSLFAGNTVSPSFFFPPPYAKKRGTNKNGGKRRKGLNEQVQTWQYGHKPFFSFHSPPVISHKHFIQGFFFGVSSESPRCLLGDKSPPSWMSFSRLKSGSLPVPFGSSAGLTQALLHSGPSGNQHIGGVEIGPSHVCKENQELCFGKRCLHSVCFVSALFVLSALCICVSVCPSLSLSVPFLSLTLLSSWPLLCQLSLSPPHPLSC